MSPSLGSSTSPLSCRLEELSTEDSPQCGNKAVSLGILLRSGFPVPPGIALSVQVYETFLSENPLPCRIEECVAYGREIRESLIHGHFPAEILDLLKRIYPLLTANNAHTGVVVRSSTICEDGAHRSMAGLFDSFVPIRSLSEMIKSIKKCYASLFGDRVLSMIGRGISFADLKMGILIQRFVPGSPSGVLFSADTVAMDANVLVVNSVNGPCRHYVDGFLPSASYRIRKSSGEIITAHGVSTETQISIDRLNKLRDVALRIEDRLGPNQDIEWTMAGTCLYILQARPITTFITGRSDVTWPSLHNSDKTWYLDESAPRPLRPLEQDIAEKAYKGYLRGMAATGKGSGIEFRFIHGHSYVHRSLQRTEHRATFEAKVAELASKGKNIFQDEMLPKILAYVEVLDSYAYGSLNRKEVASFMEKAFEYHGLSPELHFMAVDGSLYLDTFVSFCKEICNGLTTEDVHDLLYQPSLLTVDRESVISMAHYVKSNQALSDLFADQLYDTVLFARLGRSDAGRCLKSKIEAYLEKFGLFPEKHEPLLVPRSAVLLEDPSLVITRIRGCLTVDTDGFFRRQKARELRKDVVLNLILRQLPDTDHQSFTVKLEAAGKAFLVEDDHCYYLDLCAPGYLRLAIKKAGEYLSQKGAVAAADEVYFLKYSELNALLHGKKLNVGAMIEERRKVYFSQKLLNPPSFLGKEPSSGPDVDDQSDHEMGTIKIPGLPGGRRSARGSAVVATGAFRLTEIKEPCILILPHGHGQYLLPYLGKILGLVFEKGSPFDHQGIIAREMDIPTIYHVENATKVIHTDDIVQIDARKGWVVIEKKGAVY